MEGYSASHDESGPAIFFDGESTTRHPVTVELDPKALLIRGEDGRLLASWPYGEMEQSATPEGLFRIGHVGSRKLERLEVRDPALAAAIDELSIPVDRTGLRARRNRRKVVLWSLAAVISLLAIGIFGVPEVATRLAPYVPAWMELRLGEAINQQARAMLDPGERGVAFECGTNEKEKEGKAALDKMVGRLEAAAGLHVPLKLKVVRHKQANAFAIAGGYIYVLQGLIDKAEGPDEVAGVIAHEMGHVAHRDSLRSVLQAGGVAFLFGAVLGDFVGGGAVVLASKTILQLRYSRVVEAQADGYAVELMHKVGGNPRALSTILARISGTGEPATQILLNHPATKDRANWIETHSRPEPGTPLLSAEEWQALKRICAGS